MRAAARERFLEDYVTIRRAEGRGSDDPAYYLALPYRDLSGRHADQWAIRARTYRYFERHVLAAIERDAGRPLAILDLGAGNGWMSYRVALRNHSPVAVDILTDPRDGLLAARHYFAHLGRPFPLVDAEFDDLPFGSARFDVAVYNASIHYSADYLRTLAEARRCLRPGGRVVILDSPVYRRREDGEKMRRERHAQFEAMYGCASDHAGSVEYFDEAMLGEMAKELDLTWEVHRPWYGWKWHLRPWKAWLNRQRAPSRFWILVGRFNPR